MNSFCRMIYDREWNRKHVMHIHCDCFLQKVYMSLKKMFFLIQKIVKKSCSFTGHYNLRGTNFCTRMYRLLYYLGHEWSEIIFILCILLQGIRNPQIRSVPVLTVLYWGWRQHIVTNGHRLYTLALLTGGKKQGVKNCHLVPDVIFALKYAEKQIPCFSFKCIKDPYRSSDDLSFLSPCGILTCSVSTEKIICWSPTSEAPTLPYFKENK